MTSYQANKSHRLIILNLQILISRSATSSMKSIAFFYSWYQRRLNLKDLDKEIDLFKKILINARIRGELFQIIIEPSKFVLV